MNLIPKTPHWDVLTYEQKLRMLVAYARKQYIYSRRKWYWIEARRWKAQWETYLDSLKHFRSSIDICNHEWYRPARPAVRCRKCLAERHE